VGKHEHFDIWATKCVSRRKYDDSSLLGAQYTAVKQICALMNLATINKLAYHTALGHEVAHCSK